MMLIALATFVTRILRSQKSDVVIIAHPYRDDLLRAVIREGPADDGSW